MCYLIAKDRESHGCYALKTEHGKSIVELKRKLNKAVGYKGVQLVTLSRPTAFGEYNCPCSYPLYDDFRFEPIKENKEDADDDVRDQLYFGVQCGHPYGSDYMYEIFTGRNGYDIEFKCKNKKEVLQVIDQLAKDFEKEKHQ